MHPLQKAYWKAKNLYEVHWKQADVKGLGCLPHRQKDTDFVFGGWGKNPPKPTKEYSFTGNEWTFNQNPLNICVFASNTMASSYQEVKRFSVKFAVKLGKRLGLITGNGFSYLRAGLDISQKYGRLPYEMMPDEVSNWFDYCKDDITDEQLAEALKWKAPSYQKVTSPEDAVSLLEQGYCLVTALMWYSGMNMPTRPDYYLRPWGSRIGGHAICINGSRAPSLRFQDYINKQTFGVLYGDKGMVHVKDIFASGFFDVYMMEKIEGRTDEERLNGLNS